MKENHAFVGEPFDLFRKQSDSQPGGDDALLTTGLCREGQNRQEARSFQKITS
jgi:hypothetical protein